MSNIIPQISVDEFLIFKSENMDILLDAQEYIKRVGNTNKINKLAKNQTEKKKPNNSYQNYNKKQNWKNQSKYNNSRDNNRNHYTKTRTPNYENEDDLLYTKFRSFLNKLSSNNIVAISNEIKLLPLTKDAHIEKLIDFIFSKAIKEFKFTTIYAIFVSHMMTFKINLESTEITFASLFFPKCKEIFKKCLAFDVELEKQYLDEVNTKVTTTFNFKDEVIGCINFIGELYNYRILNDNAIIFCLNSIMQAMDNKKVYCIDIICNFLRTIAKKFSLNNDELLNAHLKNLLKIKDTMNIKEKFLIMDLIDYMNKNNISNIKY